VTIVAWRSLPPPSSSRKTTTQSAVFPSSCARAVFEKSAV
jgi:hypothetical protein